MKNAHNNMHATPDWFARTEQLNPVIMSRLANSLAATKLDISVKFFPEQAFWFMCDILVSANQANRDGMHANALAITRLCVEAIAIIEIGLIGGKEAERVLQQWSHNEKTPGQLRAWLEANAWPNYGSGMWGEPWSTFFANFARSIQPFAHYSGLLAQWQSKLFGFSHSDDGGHEIVQFGPRLYDAQKATRITLFHGIISFILGRIVVANGGEHDAKFSKEIQELGAALGTSPYLDGHSTDWPQQFWAMLWFGESARPKQE